MVERKLLVTKHNDLIEANYKLTLEEQRLILSCIAKIDSRFHKDVPDEITVTAEEYAGHFGLQLKNAYHQLRCATNQLYERDIKIKNDKGTRRRRWVYGIHYHDQEGRVSLKFSPDIKPYIGQLNGLFKSYQLEHIASLKSSYSIRVYELLNQWMDTGRRFILVVDFRAMLMLGEKYPRFADLNRWVISPALKEINKKTDLTVKLTTDKKGRAVYKLNFHFSRKVSEALGAV